MKVATLIIMLSNWQGGSAINASLSFFSMADCVAAAKQVNAAAPSGTSSSVSAVCVETRS